MCKEVVGRCFSVLEYERRFVEITPRRDLTAREHCVQTGTTRCGTIIESFERLRRSVGARRMSWLIGLVSTKI